MQKVMTAQAEVMLLRKQLKKTNQKLNQHYTILEDDSEEDGEAETGQTGSNHAGEAF